MGLISNMFNYSKPGPGIEKEEQQKRRFFLFFELFFRKFWKLIQLNLLYILFWIPPLIAGTLLTPYNATLAYLAFFLVGTFTAGPATAGADLHSPEFCHANASVFTVRLFPAV